MKRCLVTGASGLIGTNLVARLKRDGHFVRAVGRNSPLPKLADEHLRMDLRHLQSHDHAFNNIDEVFQLAADAGGIAYEEDPANDAARLRDSVRINLNVLEACRVQGAQKVFFPSSGTVYAPDAFYYHWEKPVFIPCREFSIPPANPSSEYGWEKLFSERLYAAYHRSFGLQVRIARIHSTYGTPCIWDGPRARAPAALCRKIAQAEDGGTIDVIGDGQQMRSFQHVDDCVEGIVRLMASDFCGPVNLGSSEVVTINRLIDLICEIAGKAVQVRNIDGPVGVAGRCSDNTLIREVLGWEPTIDLRKGLAKLYPWVKERLDIAVKPM